MIRLIAALLLCCVMTGCATVNSMAFDKQSATIDTKEKSVLLMVVDVSRSDGSRYVPEPYYVGFQKPAAREKGDYQNFVMKKDADSLHENGHNVYFARIALAPGQYKLGHIMGTASAFPINSTFNVPLNMDVSVKPGTITYVGRITATLRERVGSEFRAGLVVPLVDQAITGMSGGTWDVSIVDAFDKDMALFRTMYPVLKGAQVESVPLPAFDRAAAQRWWDNDFKEVPAPATGGTTVEPVAAR